MVKITADEIGREKTLTFFLPWWVGNIHRGSMKTTVRSVSDEKSQETEDNMSVALNPVPTERNYRQFIGNLTERKRTG